MTDQEVFDKVIAHLRAQKCQSVDDTNQCVYRGPRGEKCAAGIFIPDDQYFPWMEGKFVVHEKMAPIFEKQGIDIGLLNTLQRFHDSMRNWDHNGIIEERIRELAAELSLSYSS